MFHISKGKITSLLTLSRVGTEEKLDLESVVLKSKVFPFEMPITIPLFSIVVYGGYMQIVLSV